MGISSYMGDAVSDWQACSDAHPLDPSACAAQIEAAIAETSGSSSGPSIPGFDFMTDIIDPIQQAALAKYQADRPAPTRYVSPLLSKGVMHVGASQQQAKTLVRAIRPPAKTSPALIIGGLGAVGAAIWFMKIKGVF